MKASWAINKRKKKTEKNTYGLETKDREKQGETNVSEHFFGRRRDVIVVRFTQIIKEHPVSSSEMKGW